MVDRFKVREDLQQRLAESFETALKLADGVAKVVSMDDDSDQTLFSARFACSECGYSIAELEPRMFSLIIPPGPVRPVMVWASSSLLILPESLHTLN